MVPRIFLVEKKIFFTFGIFMKKKWNSKKKQKNKRQVYNQNNWILEFQKQKKNNNKTFEMIHTILGYITFEMKCKKTNK